MYRKNCTCILLAVFCHFSGSRALEIEIKQRGTDALWGNDTELICSFTITPGDNVLSVVSLAFRAYNETVNGSELLVYFTPTSSGTYFPAGVYLRDRVKLNSSFISTSSGQATLSFKNLTCVDEKVYDCQLTMYKSSGTATEDSKTTNLSAQASPLQPETVSQLNSTQALEEGQDVAFKCEGNVGKPPGRYVWQKIRRNNIELATYYNVTTVPTVAPDSCTYTGISILTIRVTADDNQAVMRCWENSTASLYKDSQPINVLYKVRTQNITKHPNQTHYKVGSGYIELTCHADGNPQSNYTWYKGDNMNQILSSNATFVIDSNNTTNNGTFLCQAFNSLNGRMHNQTQSVDIFLVYNIPTSTPTSTFHTGILKAENKAFCEEDYCKILFGVGAGIFVGLVLAIIFGIVRFHRKNSEKLIDTDNATLRNNSPRNNNGSASMNRGYEDTETLPMSSMKKTDRKGTSSKENKTLNYVEVDFVGDETIEITKDKKPVQEHPLRKNETVYSVVQKTTSVGNRQERMFTEERHGLQLDEDDPYADNNALYDHLGNSRHKPNTAGEIFDHQQSSAEAKNSMKF